MSKYMFEYKDKLVRCDLYAVAFDLLGFSLKFEPTHDSDSPYSITVEGCEVKHSYGYGGLDSMTQAEIKTDVVNHVCTVYKNTEYRY